MKSRLQGLTASNDFLRDLRAIRLELARNSARRIAAELLISLCAAAFIAVFDRLVAGGIL